MFPKLTNVIHTGHKTIRGTSKFKESMLYAKKDNISLRIPGTEASWIAFECYWGGEMVKQYTNEDLVNAANEFASKYYNQDPLNPIYLTLSLSTPLGFSAFLAAASSGRKIFHPSSYTLNELAKGF
jgi:hypothetical protein